MNSERFKSYTERMVDMDMQLEDAVILHLQTIPELTKKILGIDDDALTEAMSTKTLKTRKIGLKPPPIQEKTIKAHKMRGIALVAHPSMRSTMLEFIDECALDTYRSAASHVVGTLAIAGNASQCVLACGLCRWSDELSRFKISVDEDIEDEVKAILGVKNELGAALAKGELGGDSQVATQLVVEQVRPLFDGIWAPQGQPMW